MIETIDAFNRMTLYEVITANGRVGFITRRERQVLYESFDIDIAKAIVNKLQEAINKLEEEK